MANPMLDYVPTVIRGRPTTRRTRNGIRMQRVGSHDYLKGWQWTTEGLTELLGLRNGIQGLFIAKTWGYVAAPASSDLSPPNGLDLRTHHFTHGTWEAQSYSTRKCSATIALGRPHWQIRKFDQPVTFNPFRPLSCPQGLGAYVLYGQPTTVGRPKYVLGRDLPSSQ